MGMLLKISCPWMEHLAKIPRYSKESKLTSPEPVVPRPWQPQNKTKKQRGQASHMEGGDLLGC